MRKHLPSAVRGIAFLLLLILSLHYINLVVTPKFFTKNTNWPTTSTYSQFYEMEKDSVDVLFLGSSVAVNAFSPQEIYNSYGIRSYNLGSEQQSIFLSYFWLKEALRFQSPKVVILETKYLFNIHDENVINTAESLTRKCLDAMKWSEVKREAVSDLCSIDSTQSEMSYYLKNIRFHTRWTDLQDHDFLFSQSKNNELKGFSPLTDYGPESFDAFVPSGDTTTMEKVPEIMMTYLDRITRLCADSGIKLVLVSLPGNSMSDSYNNTLTSYAEENGADYYNLCEEGLYNSIGAVLPGESIVSHENIWGSIKMSRYIGGLLSGTYGIGSTVDPQYESTNDYYQHVIKNCELTRIKDVNEYLKAVDDDHYTVFITGCTSFSIGLTDQFKASMSALGLQTDLTQVRSRGYVAVISSENGVTEALGSTKYGNALMSGSINDYNTLYTVSSSGNPAENTAYVDIGGTRYNIATNGFQFVVYDNTLLKVIDRVIFNTRTEAALSR